MKTHKFDVEDAEKYGLQKALLLEHLKFHQENNINTDRFNIDGKVWCEAKRKTLEKIYPYLNGRSMSRWLTELEEEGVIESIKPKKSGGDHYKYYHVIGHKISNGHSDQSNGQNDQSMNGHSDQSSIITKGNNFNEGESFSERLKNAEDKQALLEVWLAYRRKKNKHATNFEKDVILNQDWKDKSTDRIREAISYTVKNGWLSLQWPEVEESQGQMSYHKELD